MEIPTTPLSNGVQVPVLGFGTYKVTENVEPIVSSAIEVGYRHIDTAQMYGNEAQVGAAWESSGLPRESFFLTSKLDNPHHNPDDARRAFDKTLRDLRTDRVDLFLIHWPLPDLHPGGYHDLWRVLEDFYEQGTARAIGTSNFFQPHLEMLLRDASVTPHVNQIESHPYLPCQSLHEFDSSHDIVTEAWSPLARGKVITDPLLTQIGQAHGKSAAQVAIRWGLQRGDILFPKASNTERQMQNIDVFDFVLSEREMKLIATLDRGDDGRVGSHPDQKR
ncbi:aldo/keto reductase [Actinomycetaceae bacterium WB03_NA08]|uniref:Aldo/keto reductase n=1 Tax=Scrofimicrobium canadense TaxID=2652290 RepID=A0A6N7W804_9ACTO|nr:aldo/keto reductase [Scrofimicrobium canadense]MSS84268.1 aldo/keto reductase [Scrofimicrobium canadense]